ncbi:MAG: hypothetical protein LBO09_02155 [Candidatus Peribacteria bacterium]|jgi:hypothetical protein|nr:hypothetical protein [Candidatus Peribacteria bacterium]
MGIYHWKGKQILKICQFLTGLRRKQILERLDQKRYDFRNEEQYGKWLNSDVAKKYYFDETHKWGDIEQLLKKIEKEIYS